MYGMYDQLQRAGMRVLIVVEEIKNAAAADGHILGIS
jgi:hypothetical protein